MPDPIGDEKQYRKPTWVEGVNVVLGDGAAWALPRPLIRWAPAGEDIVQPYVRFGPGGKDVTYGDLVKAYEQATDGTAVIKAVLGMGRYLLLANYDLTDDQVAELLQFSWSDDDVEGTRIRNEVTDVAMGRGKTLPKP